MNTWSIRIYQLILLPVFLVSCDNSTPPTSLLQTFDEYLKTISIKSPLPMIDESDFIVQTTCTPITDPPPYTKTTESALTFIKENIDESFYHESTAFLTNGINYKVGKINKPLPYSAYFTDRSILLFENLFKYGCLEDVISTLIHELVHSVQKSRFLAPGYQSGEHSLRGNNVDKLIAELEADAYQAYISNHFKLASVTHIKNMAQVNNSRRRQFNEL